MAVLPSAQEKEMPDFTEKDRLVWYTPNPNEPPRLYVPRGRAREQLLREAHDTPIGGH